MSSEIESSWLKMRLRSVTIEALLEHEIECLSSSSDIPREKLAKLIQARPKDKYQAFLMMTEPGDELWSYRTPEITWQRFCGHAGYAIVRDGEVAASVATIRN